MSGSVFIMFKPKDWDALTHVVILNESIYWDASKRSTCHLYISNHHRSQLFSKDFWYIYIYIHIFFHRIYYHRASYAYFKGFSNGIGLVLLHPVRPVPRCHTARCCAWPQVPAWDRCKCRSGTCHSAPGWPGRWLSVGKPWSYMPNPCLIHFNTI